MVSDALNGTSRPARFDADSKMFSPASKSETLAFVSSAKTQALSTFQGALSVRFESVISVVTPFATTMQTLPSVFLPEIVKGPAPSIVNFEVMES
ncbi:MAG: hypothetical protein BWY95_01491 [Bacteroidetes bacterium ADurb.BinA104]|nr:MAG: hypothetical protein BWY95_01491 [Bacteroidetes bacterium ADurb.BinA104]